MFRTFDRRLIAELARFNTPTVSNALELCCKRSRLEGSNLEETRDFMPDLGPMVGYAVTAEYCATREAVDGANLTADLLRLIDNAPEPVVVVIRDVDSPDGIIGAQWGECFSTICQALGATGTITDGAIRDYDEMVGLGFHALARRLCVSHAYGHIVRVGEPVTVFGAEVKTGDLVHADQHGFLTVPPDAVPNLPAAAAFLEKQETEHVLSTARAPGFTVDRFLEARKRFRDAIGSANFGATGEGEQ